jgi:hypothetical protein
MSNLLGAFDAWLYGNGGAISAFSAQYTIINAPEQGGSIAISNNPVSLSLTQPGSTDTAHIYSMPSATFGPLNSNAMVYLKLTATNPTTSVAVAAAGIRLQ